LDGGGEAADEADFVPFVRKGDKIKNFRVAEDVNILGRLFTSAASCWLDRVDYYDPSREEMWVLPCRQDPSVLRWSSVAIWRPRLPLLHKIASRRSPTKEEQRSPESS